MLYECEIFPKTQQKVKIKSVYKRKVIYPKVFKLKTGSDLLISLKEMTKKENKSGYILSIVGNLSKAKIQCPGKKTFNFNKKYSRDNISKWDNRSQ